MEFDKYINAKYRLPQEFSETYSLNNPFPHIVFEDFINEDLINDVNKEFPDLLKLSNKLNFKTQNEIKLTSIGMEDLSPSAFKLISFLNSDIFLIYLQKLTGIKEKLFSDPYLLGGGYHEIKKGGFLDVHADFNKYKDVNLDRRINLLLYLNHDWNVEWNGNLGLYSKDDLKNPKKIIKPDFNRCVIFTTTSNTYHGHPEKLRCPDGTSRKSIALYYYSYGRPASEMAKTHGTRFRNDKNFFKDLIKDLLPPIISRNVKKLLKKD
tara:strand:- start:138 stop:932 length:795 start_codon:yes stop_codon:yes gene_type:complete